MKLISKIMAISLLLGPSIKYFQVDVNGNITYPSISIPGNHNSSSETVDLSNFQVASESVCEEDRIKEGYGCVTGELKDFAIDTSEYYLGVESSKPVMVADKAGGNAYVYIYQTNAEFYKSVTLSTSKTLDPDVDGDFLEDWKDYSLELVSYNIFGSLAKYKIKDFVASLEPARRYAINKLVAFNGNITDSVLEFMLQPSFDDPKRILAKINTLNSVKVTQKEVAFQLMRIKGSDTWEQAHYAAYNLSKNLADITKVELQFNTQSYTCHTNIKDTVLDSLEDNFTYKFKGPDSCSNDGSLRYGSNEYHKIFVTPLHKKVHTSGVFAKRDYEWDTIGLVKDIPYVNKDLVSKYKYFVNFWSNKVYAPREYMSDTDFVRYYNVKDAANPAIDIKNLNFLTFWYKEEGKEKKAVAVDNYQSSSGNIPFQKPPAKQLWKTILTSIVAGVSGVALILLLIKFWPKIWPFIKSVFNSIKNFFRRLKEKWRARKEAKAKEKAKRSRSKSKKTKSKATRVKNKKKSKKGAKQNDKKH